MVSDCWVAKHPAIIAIYMEKSKDFSPYILPLGSVKVFLLEQQEKQWIFLLFFNLLQMDWAFYLIHIFLQFYSVNLYY